MTLRTLALLSIPALFVAACGSSAVSPDGGCSVGATEVCNCTGGGSGMETCGSDGSFGACVCGAGGGSGGGSGGGAAGGTGGGAAGGTGGGAAGGTGGGAAGGTGGGAAGGTGGGAAGGTGGGTAGGTGGGAGGGSGGGSAGSPTASFSSAPINFGLAACGGAQPGPATLAITNSGTAPLSYTATLASAAAFGITAGGTNTSLAPNATADGQITPAAVPANAVAGTPITTTVTITTNDPAHASTTIDVSITPQGGVLTVSPSPVDAGAAIVGMEGTPAVVALTNIGNGGVTVNLGAPSNLDFGATYTGADAGVAVLSDGGTLPGLEAFFTPSMTGVETASVPLLVTGATCANSATSISVTGLGEVFPTAGFDAGTLNFGLVGCGVPDAGSETLAITNTGSGTLTYTATLASTAAFNIDGGSSLSGALTANQTGHVTVAADPVPTTESAGQVLNTTLTLTTNDPAHTSTSIPVQVTAAGGVVNLSPATATFAATAVDQTAANYPVTLTNTGNEGILVSLGAASNNDFGAIYNGADAGPADAGNAPVFVDAGEHAGRAGRRLHAVADGK